jgi:hypothetical protein
MFYCKAPRSWQQDGRRLSVHREDTYGMSRAAADAFRTERTLIRKSSGRGCGAGNGVLAQKFARLATLVVGCLDASSKSRRLEKTTDMTEAGNNGSYILPYSIGQQ